MFGARLRKARYACHITQVDLANRLGVTSSYISMLEHDRKEPSVRLLRTMARVLDVSLAELLQAPEEDEHYATGMC